MRVGAVREPPLRVCCCMAGQLRGLPLHCVSPFVPSGHFPTSGGNRDGGLNPLVFPLKH